MLSVPVITVIVFLATAGAVVALALVFMDTRGGRANERLEALVGKRRKESTADVILKHSLQEGDKKTLLDALTPEMLTMNKLFEQADCNVKPSALFGVGIVFAIVAGAFSFMLTRNFIIAPIVGMVAFTFPMLWLLSKRRKRLKTFAAQLPDALELVARALRAGHSLGAGMHVVAEEMPEPISTEFGRVYDEQNLGIALDEAMKTMCERVPNLDLRFFVTAVAIQRQTGGDLAEILDKIGYVVRERYKIMGQVRALTAEGRLSGVVLISLPFILLLVMMHLNYKYIQVLWTHPVGIKMAIGGCIMMFLGALVIKKIVDIKV